jgi:DNA-binding beta-propeller fold protein YncE
VPDPAGESLWRVDTPDIPVRRLAAPDGIAPAVTAVGACGVWVADASGKVVLIDPGSASALAQPLRVGASIATLAPSETGGVWVADPIDGELALVDVEPAG